MSTNDESEITTAATAAILDGARTRDRRSFEEQLETRSGSFLEHLAALDAIAAGLAVDPTTGCIALFEQRARASAKASLMREACARVVEARIARSAAP